MSVASLRAQAQGLAWSSLPTAPFERLRELLRRLGLLSAVAAVLSFAFGDASLVARGAGIAAIVGLSVAWFRAGSSSGWSIGEQAVEGALVCITVATSLPVSLGLPALYGGLNFRAFGRGRSAAMRAALLYLIAFSVAMLFRHWAVGGSAAGELAIVLPGIPFCAIMLHALSRALQGQERAEARLRENEVDLRGMIDAAPIAIIGLADRAVTMWSPGAERLFGYTAAEVVDRRVPAVADALAGCFAELERAELAGEVPQHLECVGRRKDGTRVDVLVSAAPWHDAAGKARGTIALLADISGRKELEVQLRQAQKMEAVGQLAGGIAHDFNNLLTVIMAHAEFLEEGLSPSEEQLTDVKEIHRAAKGAATLTRQLLAFSRKQVLKPVVLDLAETILEFSGLQNNILGEHIEAVTRFADEPVWVLADPGQLEEAVFSLAVNARDAMPSGGVLTIETRVARNERRITVSPEGTLPPGEFAVLSIRDTGTGMTPEVQSRIFEPFFTTKDVGRGPGLGLSTVFGIISQSNGYIAVSSHPGCGTVFHIYLPLQSVPPSSWSPSADTTETACDTHMTMTRQGADNLFVPAL